jgi:hypothetical protein
MDKETHEMIVEEPLLEEPLLEIPKKLCGNDRQYGRHLYDEPLKK